MIFANWRGFSGGTRDMYGEVLKFGAMIVDALREYKHPVFVYIPPGGELRGGAWVVIDPTINEKKMEMYADVNSRGGILEPPGICEVKYRTPEQKMAMHRLDPALVDLDDSLGASMSTSDSDKTNMEILQREKLLSPLYTQIAHEFADLHDRSGRMKAKGVISDALEWKNARRFFAYRVRRRQLEDNIIDQMLAASNKTMDFFEAKAKLDATTPEGNDKEVLAWLESNESAISTLVATVKSESVETTMRGMLDGMSSDEVKQLLKKFK